MPYTVDGLSAFSTMDVLNDGSDWTTLSPDVIDRLVLTLKSTRRWRRDGPALRRLNRHWYYQLNNHFTVIRPHHSRRLLPSSMCSLSRFPHLTYLDAVTFTEESNEHGFRSAVESMGRHPSLSALKLPGSRLAILSDKELQNLRGMSSLEIENSKMTRMSTAKQVMQLPLKRLVTSCSAEELNSLVANIPTLKELTVCVSETVPEIDVTALNRLDVLHLKSLVYQDAIDYSQLQSLVSLELSLDHRRLNAQALNQLPRLKQLSMISPAVETFYDNEFLELLKKLDSLEIGASETNAEIIVLPNFIDEPLNLQSLLLHKCSVRTVMLRSNLPRLRHLSVKRCLLSNDDDWLSSMHQLTKLCLTGSLAVGLGAYPELPLPFDSRIHSKLKILTLGDCGYDGRRLEVIAQLEGLEVLGLHHHESLPRERYQCLERLTNLKVMGLFGAAVAPAVQALMGHDYLVRLEELWLDTSLIALWDKESLGDIHAFGVRLNDRVPHLKVTAKGNAYKKFVCKHHSSGGYEIDF